MTEGCLMPNGETEKVILRVLVLREVDSTLGFQYKSLQTLARYALHSINAVRG